MTFFPTVYSRIYKRLPKICRRAEDKECLSISLEKERFFQACPLVAIKMEILSRLEAEEDRPWYCSKQGSCSLLKAMGLLMTKQLHI